MGSVCGAGIVGKRVFGVLLFLLSDIANRLVRYLFTQVPAIGVICVLSSKRSGLYWSVCEPRNPK